MLSAAELKELARQAGFHRAGLARAQPLDPGPLDRWLASGHAADMDWLARRRAERLDVRLLLPSARTVLALGVGYGPLSPGPVSRYARGRDYHYTLRDRLKRLRKALLARHPALPSYGSVDANPVMEKVWAERAGLGFLGKHSLLIAPGLGSRLVLACLILGEEADAYDQPLARQCGECTLCLQACPTRALPQPGVVDSRRCLSYQTIENPGSVPEELRSGMAGVVFGCDLCQACCPWNARPIPEDPGFAERPLGRLSALELAGLTPERYAELMPGSALVRAGYHALRRNAALALGAARDPAARPALERLAQDPDPVVAEAARWALQGLGTRD